MEDEAAPMEEEDQAVHYHRIQPTPCALNSCPSQAMEPMDVHTSAEETMADNITGLGCKRRAISHEREGSGHKPCASRPRREDPLRAACKRENVEVGRAFQLAVMGRDWRLAESFIPMADAQRLNDGLCIALDSVWFLSTEQELEAVTLLMQKLVEVGAADFSRAALRTSFLASCVSACRSRTITLTDTVTVMADRLHERLQECNGDELLKAEAAAKVQRFTEWALKCIGSHSYVHSKGEDKSFIFQSSAVESQLQLMTFKRFLELAGDRLTGKDYTEAFDAACFPLTLFSSAMDPGWASGIAASALQGLLTMLVEGGADNINQCFLEAARFGSTELVRILLQIAQHNNTELDVDLALGFASHYCKISTMECLVAGGNTNSFLGPLMRAAERGCMQVVQWFVERGCKDMELCLALTAAASNSQIEVAGYLLKHVPRHVLYTLSAEILKAAGERSGGSLKGITFLLQSNFLDNEESTYHIADCVATSEDESIMPELKAYLQVEWSEKAFVLGRTYGRNHFVNVMRVIEKARSPLHLQDLPLQLQFAIAYLPLYRKCVSTPGVLLSQWLRGQLVEAALQISGSVNEDCLLQSGKQTLLLILETQLPSFIATESKV